MKQKKGFYERYVKRMLDFTCALFGLILISPVLLVIAILVRTKLGSPIIFKQQRPGLNEEIFTLYKFRTMTNACDKSGKLLSDTDRLTLFGKILRSTSLDELPELLNVVKGDMSIVGPRPLAVEYLPYYTEDERQRHSVSAGLTGLAQISGRNLLDWEERFKKDIEYINSISFITDLKIFFLTIKKVLTKSDVAIRGTQNVCDFDQYRLNQMEGVKK